MSVQHLDTKNFEVTEKTIFYLVNELHAIYDQIRITENAVINNWEGDAKNEFLAIHSAANQQISDMIQEFRDIYQMLVDISQEFYDWDTNLARTIKDTEFLF